jgi:hypothetical protein
MATLATFVGLKSDTRCSVVPKTDHETLANNWCSGAMIGLCRRSGHLPPQVVLEDDSEEGSSSQDSRRTRKKQQVAESRERHPLLEMKRCKHSMRRGSMMDNIRTRQIFSFCCFELSSYCRVASSVARHSVEVMAKVVLDPDHNRFAPTHTPFCKQRLGTNQRVALSHSHLCACL